MRFIAPCGASFADTEQLHTRTAGSQFREHFIKRTSLRKDHSVTKSLMFTECLLRAEFWTWTPHVTLPTKPRSNYCQPLWQVPSQAWGLPGLPTDHKLLSLERREGKPLEDALEAHARLCCVLSSVVN